MEVTSFAYTMQYYELHEQKQSKHATYTILVEKAN